MTLPPLDPDELYQIWYMDYTRKAKRRKFVAIPGTFGSRGRAWSHVFRLANSRLYNTGCFVCRPVGQAPDSIPSWNYLNHFFYGRG